MDAGNALHRNREWPATGMPQARVTAGVVAQGLAQTGIDAMALGGHDWWLGTDFVHALVREHSLPILAANLTCDGTAPYPSGMVVERGSLRFGIVGVTAGEPEGCDVGDPRILAESALAALGEVDVAVLLAPEGERALDAWGRDQSAFDLVVVGNSDIPSTTAAPWGSGWRVQSGARGKHVGVATVEPVAGADGLTRSGDGTTPVAGAHRFSTRLIPLAEALREDPAVAAIVLEGKARIAAEEAAPVRPIDSVARRVPSGSTYAGRDTCTGCHVQADAQWQTTSHAHAWTTLDAAGRGLDRSCVGCHVTGWEQEGGPQEPAAIGPFRDVQCEACHGPSAAHVADPAAVKPVRSPAVTVCTTCHDGERDGGQFDAETYLPRVHHGQGE
ncbi:MAG: hypothetical protein ACI855_000277 [Myxococcota bacterium]